MSGQPGAGGLRLTVWAAVLGGSTVLACCAAAAAVLRAEGVALRPVLVAVLAACVAGAAVVLVAVRVAAALSAAVRALSRDAVERLQDPDVTGSVPVRPRVARGSAELAELAAVLEALHLRVRLGDQVGERHREQAETAGAGVFELLSGLVAAEEGTRGQLAAELHDTVAQSLMVARRLLADGATTDAELAAVADHVEDAEEQVRAVMARTRPPALREGDLASAVDDLRLDVRARYGLDVTLVWPGAPYPLPLASAVTVYRFFQEALLNVVKHADVDEAVLELAVDAHTVRASVTDRGPGFTPSEVRSDRGRHVGLGLLRERARLSGGSLKVRSAPGAGTTLELALPRPTVADDLTPARLPVPAG